MKTSLSLVLALASSGAALQITASPARAAETPAQRTGRAALVAVYQKMDRAMIAGDAATAVSYFAPDYSMKSIDGEVRNRAKSEAMLRQVLAGSMGGVAMRFSKMNSRIVSLTWRGKDAVVTSQTTGVANAGTGAQAVRVEAVSQSRDYWTPTARGWKIRQSVETQSKMWANGKRIR